MHSNASRPSRGCAKDSADDGSGLCTEAPMAFSAAVELTCELVRQDTINPPGNERRCASILAQRLEANGFAVTEDVFGVVRSSVIAWIGRGGNGGGRLPLAFTGHIDTVPLGARPWSVDPFGGEIDGDRLYGRGASDMKSG